jgi:hypothetical protein
MLITLLTTAFPTKNDRVWITADMDQARKIERACLKVTGSANIRETDQGIRIICND